MNYKDFLTKEAAEQFKKEGATAVVISLLKKSNMIREIEVRLTNEVNILYITGKTPEINSLLSKFFCPSSLEEEWYPFTILYNELSDDFVKEILPHLKGVAETLSVRIDDLAWKVGIMEVG